MKKRIALILLIFVLTFAIVQKQSIAFISNSISYLLNYPFTASGGRSRQALSYKMPIDIIGQNTIQSSISTSYVLNTGALPVYFSKSTSELPDGGDQKVIDTLMVYSTKSKSALIVWESSQAEQGQVYYGKDDANIIAADIRDSNIVSNIHFVEIKNLSPNTEYVFKVVSDNLDYNNNTLLYGFRTGDVFSPNLNEDIVYGKVLENDLVTPVANALVVLKLVNNDSYGSVGESCTQVAVTDEAGNWFYDLKSIRTSDGFDHFDYSVDGDLLEISVYKDLYHKQIHVDTNSDSPVADIALN